MAAVNPTFEGTASAGAASTTSPPPSSNKAIKRLLTFFCIITAFVFGLHFGGGSYLRKQGYGAAGRAGEYIPSYSDAIQEFVERDLLPTVNATLAALLESDESSNGTTAKPARPGETFKKQAIDKGLAVGAKHPVLFVPGFITGGLQLWSGEECLKHRFRESIWGSTGMATAFLADRNCWMKHVALDPLTGMDPEGGEIKVRPQTGFEAADYFISGFWILSKLIQSLADVGYDPSNMDMITYDWRMAFPLLEERDGFLTDFKLKVERMVEKNGEKVVLLGHSMGNCLIFFFLRWVSEPKESGGGGGGTNWVERNVHSFVNIGGPLLGVPKAVSAILSGEMQETAVLGKMGDLLEAYLSAKKRKDLVASWAAVWSMLPKGGPALWEIGADLVKRQGEPMQLLQKSPTSTTSQEIINGGNRGVCSDDGENVCYDPKSSPASSEIDAIITEFVNLNHEEGTIDDVLQFMLDWGGGAGPKAAAGRYHSFKSGSSNPTLAQWHNPVATPLPSAPSLKIHCLYGVGVPTERGFSYKENIVEGSSTRGDPPFVIDPTHNDPDRNIANGVLTADGDGSVPLLSLGYMCADGWLDNEKLNPSKVDVITKEYMHEASFSVSDPLARSGPRSGEHCDVLGNEELAFDVLKIVTGAGDVDTRIVSNIKEIAKRINSHDMGGLDYVSKAESRYQPGPIPSN